jgi:hypothetical protein
MAKKSIVTENDLFKEDIVERLRNRIPDIEKRVIDDIFRIIDTFDSAGGLFTGGILNAEQLLQVSDAIQQSLKSAGYIQDVKLFISDFGKVTLNTAQILNDVGGYTFNKLPLSEIEQKWVNQTAETMLNSGINETFKRPILKILDETVSYGGSIEAAKQSLTDFIRGNELDGGKLSSYITQTARDSVSQLQGQQFQSIANNVETAGVRYVGGLLKDSRGQCTHWVKDLKGFIAWGKLDEEIKLAYKNEKAKKVIYETHRYGGMMPNTNKDNFLAKKGGFGCTHTAIPVRKKP